MFGSKTAIGVDIGSSSVKVVQLKRAGGGVELEKVGSARIYPDGERPSSAQDRHKARVDAVRRALAQARITAKHAVSAVSGESIIVRYLQLPEMPENELKKALQWEAEEYIPFRLDEVNIDSFILGKSSGEEARVDVLLVSAKKDHVNDHLSVIREAGLTPKIVDVDSFAFLNCYDMNYKDQAGDCAALINIGADITGISIYNGGVSRFSRDIPVGGDTITQSIRSNLRCSHAEAENYKISHGVMLSNGDGASDETQRFSGSLMETIRGTVEEMTGDEAEGPNAEEAVARAVRTVLQDLITEIQRSIEFFENQMRGYNVARIVLGGGTSALANLREYLEGELNLPVEVIDPLRQIRASSADVADRHSLAVGIGLGLRGLAA